MLYCWADVVDGGLNIEATLGQCLVFAGIWLAYIKMYVWIWLATVCICWSSVSKYMYMHSRYMYISTNSLNYTGSIYSAVVMLGQRLVVLWINNNDNFLNEIPYFSVILKQVKQEWQWHRSPSLICASWWRIKISEIREAVLCTGTSSFKYTK